MVVGIEIILIYTQSLRDEYIEVYRKADKFWTSIWE